MNSKSIQKRQYEYNGSLLKVNIYIKKYIITHLEYF